MQIRSQGKELRSGCDQVFPSFFVSVTDVVQLPQCMFTESNGRTVVV